MPAQGTALGTGAGVENSNALKGQNRFVVKNLGSPFQGWADSHSDRIPRALPWAFGFGPFGAEEKRNTKKRKRRAFENECRSMPFACASGSACQTTTIVTTSARPVVSASVLLELARWCQQRLAITEEHRCHHAAPTSQPPPAHDAHAVVPGNTSLARVDAPAASQPADSTDPVAPASRRSRRTPRIGGGR